LSDLVTTLRPLLDALVDVDLSDRDRAEAVLAERLPAEVLDRVSAELREAHARASLTPKQASERLWFGRLAKPSDATHGFSIDVVDIAEAGAAHAHPRGEVSLLVPLEGDPRFEGAARGLVVLPAGSRHVPAATGGRMLIVYFLPGGAIAWA
jgi:hypothetical protein